MMWTVISFIIGALLVWYLDVYEPYQRVFVIFAVLVIIPYMVWYRKYTKSLMRKTGTHYDGKPLTREEREKLEIGGSITLQCGKCGTILRDQSPEKIHTMCSQKKCKGTLHDVSGFV